MDSSVTVEDRGSEYRRLRVLLYADMRSVHSQAWLDGLRQSGLNVRVLSSQLVDEPDIVDVRDPVAYLRRRVVTSGTHRLVRGRFSAREHDEAADLARVDPLQVLETHLSLARYAWHRRQLKLLADDFRPDILHALRFPYEGVTALQAVRDVPVVVSSWGQDFALQAAREPLLGMWLRRTVPRLAGLFVDNKADIEWARSYGMPDVPVLEVAGNFGVDRTMFQPAQQTGRPIVVYPRGVRAYVRHETFLDVVVHYSGPEALFIGVGLDHDHRAHETLRTVGPERLQLLPALSRSRFADLIRSASVVLSPAVTDGTPNTLIEAMASGAYVIAGDVDGVRSVIGPAPCATLIDPLDSSAWADELAKVIRSGAHVRARHENPAYLGPAFSISENLDRVPTAFRQVQRGWDAH